MNNEERRMILEMLKDGAITVDEAERLMAAIPESEEPACSETSLMVAGPAADASAHLLQPKRITVLVMEGGKTKVNVRVPFSLVRAGLKIGKSVGAMSLKFTKDESSAQAMEILQNLDIDELLGSISDGDITLPYTLVDVEDPEKGEHVRVALE